MTKVRDFQFPFSCKASDHAVPGLISIRRSRYCLITKSKKKPFKVQILRGFDEGGLQISSDMVLEGFNRELVVSIDEVAEGVGGL